MTKERLAQYRFIANRISATEVEQLCTEIERLEAACREKDELLKDSAEWIYALSNDLKKLEATCREKDEQVELYRRAALKEREVERAHNSERIAELEATVERQNNIISRQAEWIQAKETIAAECIRLHDENQKMAELLDQAPHS